MRPTRYYTAYFEGVRVNDWSIFRTTISLSLPVKVKGFNKRKCKERAREIALEEFYKKYPLHFYLRLTIFEHNKENMAR